LTTTQNSSLNKSFFYRTHLLWNKLPYDLRAIDSFSKFKINLIKFLWSELLAPSDPDVDGYAQSDMAI
jgi:hypothetical protein